jgi:hypothetical protein
MFAQEVQEISVADEVRLRRLSEGPTSDRRARNLRPSNLGQNQSSLEFPC